MESAITKSVIKTISIPKWMDDEVKKRNLSLSKITQKGILKIIEKYPDNCFDCDE